MREVHAWLTAALTLALGCSGEVAPAGDLDTMTDRAEADGGMAADAGAVSRMLDGRVVSEALDADTRTATVRVDAAVVTPVVEAPPEQCSKQQFETRAVVPDMLIALDRSASMRQPAAYPDLRCDRKKEVCDFFLFNCRERVDPLCGQLKIDCTTPAHALLVQCGGTQPFGTVDRWGPSVAAVKSVTQAFDSEVRFGLMTFPGAENSCSPGILKVPLTSGASAQIADVLDRTRPGGVTPTAGTLTAALQYFTQSVPAGEGSKPQPRYVLLVTDGAPTCPNSARLTDRATPQEGLAAWQADTKLTLEALDALRAAGVKTYVVGYDAALDPDLAQSLTDFAVHGGTERYFPVQDEASLSDAFKTISRSVIACDFELAGAVPDPRLVHVKLDGVTLKPEDSNGFLLRGNTVTLQGSACGALQEGVDHNVEIVLECEPVIYI